MQMGRIELQLDIQLGEKFIQVFLLDFYKLHLPKEKYSTFYEHVLSFLGSMYLYQSTHK